MKGQIPTGVELYLEFRQGTFEQFECFSDRHAAGAVDFLGYFCTIVHRQSIEIFMYVFFDHFVVGFVIRWNVKRNRIPIPMVVLLITNHSLLLHPSPYSLPSIGV